MNVFPPYISLPNADLNAPRHRPHLQVIRPRIRSPQQLVTELYLEAYCILVAPTSTSIITELHSNVRPYHSPHTTRPTQHRLPVPSL